MKLLKAIMGLVVLALAASAYFYISNSDKDNNNDNLMQIDKTINKEYKTVQDDKDSVVESNKVLLLKVSNLEKHIKTIADTQNQQTIQLKNVTNKNKNKNTDNKDNTNNTDNKDSNTLNHKPSDNNNVVKQVVELINKGLPKIDVKNNQQSDYKISNTGRYYNKADNYNSKDHSNNSNSNYTNLDNYNNKGNYNNLGNYNNKGKDQDNYNNNHNNLGNYNNNNYNNLGNHNNNQSYIWTDAMRSGVFDEDGNYVNVATTANSSSSLDTYSSPSSYSSPSLNTYANTDTSSYSSPSLNTYANTDTSSYSSQSLNANLHTNPFADATNPQDSDFVAFADKDNNPSTHKHKTTPAYTIPSNSVLSAVLTSGLIGRIPVDGQLTEPFRFNVKITDKSFYAGGHVNNVLQDVFASGTASGDLLLSCIRASIDSITFIFADGTISDHKISDMGYLANEYGYPCIQGKLITNAAQYLGVSALFSGISGGAKAFAQSQTTTTNNPSGSSTSAVTGSPYKLLGASILSSGTQELQKWVNSRAKSSFDVIAIPSGKLVQILTQQQINIDYNPKGRKLNHQLSLSKAENAMHQLD